MQSSHSNEDPPCHTRPYVLRALSAYTVAFWESVSSPRAVPCVYPRALGVAIHHGLLLRAPTRLLSPSYRGRIRTGLNAHASRENLSGSPRKCASDTTTCSLVRSLALQMGGRRTVSNAKLGVGSRESQGVFTSICDHCLLCLMCCLTRRPQERSLRGIEDLNHSRHRRA